jgi:hypothetical protein
MRTHLAPSLDGRRDPSIPRPMFADIRSGKSFVGRAWPELGGDAVAPESTTTSWTGDELATISRAEELGLASLRGDGTLRPYVTIWVVRVAR